jgi:alpha-N-acetylglucosaminidase
MHLFVKHEILFQNWYNISDLLDAWELFLEASVNFPNNSLFNHDLVDITRQVLQNRADEIYLSIVELYKQKNMTELVKECSTFLDLLVDMDRILATHSDFLLGPFLESAKAAGSTEKEGLALAFNAKNQITLWGPNGEISDYANKQWSGVILDYFYQRWHVFFVALEVAVKMNRKVNETECRDRIFQEIELPFNVDNRDYPTYTRGDTMEISRELFEKWRHRQAQWPQVPNEATTAPPSRKPKQLIDSFQTKEKHIVATLL